MTLKIITETPAANLQTKLYNDESAMVVREPYSPSAGTAWAVIGLVLNDVVVTGDEATLISAIEALAGITSIANPRVWGQLPATLDINPGGAEPDTHRFVVVSDGVLNCNRGFAPDRFSSKVTYHGEAVPPLGKKWMVVNAVLPVPLTSGAMVTSLKSALVGLSEITTAKLLYYDAVPADASGISLTITTRMRIDPVPVA